MISWKALAVNLIFASSAAVASSSVDAPSRAATLESQVDTLFADYAKPNRPGVAVGIYQSGRVVLAKGYGMADVESGLPITAQTRFHVASVSKQFAAFAIALLARDGKLDLDADVRQYLPYLPDFGHQITTRQLILHTSGLRDQWSLFELAGKDMRDVLRQEHVVSMVKRQRELNFAPGTNYSYSNTGYSLLAEIVKAVSGSTLREFTTSRMFGALGMNGTFFFDDVRELVPGRANSYEQEKDGPWQRSLLSYQTVGATSLFTTVEDLALWAGNFSKPRVGDAALIELVTRSGTLNDGTSIHYGFGLSDLPQDGRKAISHSGSDAGFRTLFVFYPEHDAAIAVLANAPIDLKVNALANLYLPALEQATRPKAPPAPRKLSSRQLAALPGTYVYSQHPSVTITARDGKLFARSANQESELVLRPDGNFDVGPRARTYLRPVTTKNGIVGLDRLPSNGLPGDRYERVARVSSTAAELARYTGDYYSEELDITYTVALDGGKLTARTIWSAAPVGLQQVTATQFDTDAWLPHGFTFVQDTQGQITGARIHASRAYNVELRKLSAGRR